MPASDYGSWPGRNTDALPSTRFHNFAMTPPQMFTVRISFNADDPDTAERLSAAFRGGGPFLLRGPVAVKAEDGYVTVQFDRLSDDPALLLLHPERDRSDLKDEPWPPVTAGRIAAAEGAEIVAALEGFSHQHCLAIPVLRALLTLSAMQERAGLPPRREMRIDAVPAEPLHQDSLSTHRSESVHPTPARFGGSSLAAPGPAVGSLDPDASAHSARAAVSPGCPRSGGG